MLAFNGAAALIECDASACVRIFDRLGGANKLATAFAELSAKELSYTKLVATLHEPPENVSTSKPGVGVSLYLTSAPATLEATFREALSMKCRDWGLRRPILLAPRYSGTLGECTYLEIGIDTALRYDLADEGIELVAAQFGDTVELGFTKKIADPRPFEEDDFDRPVKRRGITLAPRLARLLVNLTGLTKGMVLDPFCGIGTILQEAMRLNLDVFGVDIRGDMVTASIKNLSWMASLLRREPLPYDRIKVGDSRGLGRLLKGQLFDAVVTEPILLPLFKSRPGAEAQRLMDQASSIYRTVLHQITNVLRDGGRVVIVAPTIRTAKKTLTMALDDFARGANLEPAKLPEGSPRQPYDLPSSTRWVGRRVHIYQS